VEGPACDVDRVDRVVARTSSKSATAFGTPNFCATARPRLVSSHTTATLTG
jgi:hypothetical protein